MTGPAPLLQDRRRGRTRPGGKAGIRLRALPKRGPPPRERKRNERSCQVSQRHRGGGVVILAAGSSCDASSARSVNRRLGRRRGGGSREEANTELATRRKELDSAGLRAKKGEQPRRNRQAGSTGNESGGVLRGSGDDSVQDRAGGLPPVRDVRGQASDVVETDRPTASAPQAVTRDVPRVDGAAVPPGRSEARDEAPGAHEAGVDSGAVRSDVPPAGEVGAAEGSLKPQDAPASASGRQSDPAYRPRVYTPFWPPTPEGEP